MNMKQMHLKHTGHKGKLCFKKHGKFNDKNLCSAYFFSNYAHRKKNIRYSYFNRKNILLNMLNVFIRFTVVRDETLISPKNIKCNLIIRVLKHERNKKFQKNISMLIFIQRLKSETQTLNGFLLCKLRKKRK